MRRLLPTLLVALCANACIAPNVLDPMDRGRTSAPEDQVWRAASAGDLPGMYVSSRLSGSLASVLLKVLYRFDAEGNYSGAALIDGSPPHFEVLTGSWSMNGSELTLDAAPPAQVQVSDSGSLRIGGKQGEVVLRRELDQ
jgi:hypothetical protein